MKKFSQFSIIDFLTNILPSDLIKRDTPQPQTIQKLYSIWKNPNNKIGEKVYKQPKDISQNDIEDLISYNLIQRTGGGLQITGKGSNIIKIMILGDNRSAFEMGRDIDYVTASSNIKLANRQKKKNKKVADCWWKNLNG